MSTIVKTQQELEAALADGKADIIIDSPRGVWLTVSDSATVRAWGSATVGASGSATVRAGRYVAVHLHSQSVMLSGGVVIDMTALDRSDPATWCDLNGIDVTEDGRALVYKAVDADLTAGHGHTLTAYPIGETVTAPDWSKRAGCGRGLHFGRSPMAAAGYHRGDTGPRYLACEVDLTEVVVLDDKIKARSCLVLREVDRHGREITA